MGIYDVAAWPSIHIFAKQSVIDVSREGRNLGRAVPQSPFL